MGPLIAVFSKAAIGVLLSTATLIGSLSLFQKKPSVSQQGISSYEIGKLVLIGTGVFLTYKLAREVLK
jgi:hypothetical protein